MQNPVIPNTPPARLRGVPALSGLIAVALSLTAHAGPPPTATTAAPSATVSTDIPATAALPRVIVHKSPSCGCCNGWVAHMRNAGFDVQVHDTDDLLDIKSRLGIPTDKRSCHTAEIDGYVVEGHIPANDVKRLLAQRPAAKGLALPGMPMGSPGMEMPDGRTESYTVELIEHDGGTHPFARH